MATNPMQRKAKISFLLGVLITLILAGAVIALLLMQLKNYRDKEAEERRNMENVYVLKQNVKSGEVITKNMLELKAINKNMIPENAFSNMDILNNYSLSDKEGNEIISKYPKLYLKKGEEEYELKEVNKGSYIYTVEIDGEEKEVNLVESAIVGKFDMKKNAVVTLDMITKTNEQVTDDLRKQEYNMLVLPTQLETGEYIDIRLALPSGEDYIVVPKKQVEIPQIAGIDSEDTIWVKMSEEEIITMNNAIVDAYKIIGSKLYVTIYTEAGMQNTATPTYVPTRAVKELIERDPNVVQIARDALVSRYDRYMDSVRNGAINPSINQNGEEGEENLKTKVEESITNSKEGRKQYLQSLGGDY